MKDLIKNKKIIIIGIIAIILLIIISFMIWYFISISHVGNNEEEIEITIPLGSGTNRIAEILKENNLIKNETAFKLYVKINNVSDFQAGTYYLKQSMNLKEITDMLKTGIMHDPNQLNITYLEGKNIRWLANKIAETKSVTATINIKAITGGYTETTQEEEGNNTTANSTTQSKTVKVVITVGGTTVYSDSNVDKNTTNKQATISGKGTADVVLTITDSNGGNWVRTQSVNFNNATSISFQ